MDPARIRALLERVRAGETAIDAALDELRTLAAVLFTRVRFEPCSPEPPRIVTTPTLGPKDGLRFVVRGR